MVDIDFIEQNINIITKQSEIIFMYSSHEELCKDFEYAKKKVNTAKKHIQQEETEMINNINCFLKYKEERFLFFNLTKKAYIHWYHGIRAIKIPKINNQQYYCLMNLLNNNKNIMKLYNEEYGFKYYYYRRR